MAVHRLQHFAYIILQRLQALARNLQATLRTRVSHNPCVISLVNHVAPFLLSYFTAMPHKEHNIPFLHYFLLFKCSYVPATTRVRLLISEQMERSWVQEHRFEFDEAPSVEVVSSQLSKLCLKFNGYDKDGKNGGGREEDDGLAMSRPMGVAFLLAGLDRGKPVLYHLDPSGIL